MHGDRAYIPNRSQSHQKPPLVEEKAPANPIELFASWFGEALDENLVSGNAMTLTTVADNKPAARIVLLKRFDNEGFVFFTNYESRKGGELAANPNAVLLFFWPEHERQIRVDGVVEKTSREESLEYYSSRPRESQLGAWASAQSRPLEDRQTLEEAYRQKEREFEGRDIEIPPYWGGYLLRPKAMEFWQGRPSRLHDRLLYRQSQGGWEVGRLYP